MSALIAFSKCSHGLNLLKNQHIHIQQIVRNRLKPRLFHIFAKEFPVSKKLSIYSKTRQLKPSLGKLWQRFGYCFAGGSGVFLMLNLPGKQNLLPVDCEEKHSRIINDENNAAELPFDWGQLISFAKPEFGYLLIATLSALVIAALNIKIPLMLGELINALTKFLNETSVEASSFLQQIKTPGFKLIELYIAQSFFTFVCIGALSRTGERIACRLRKELFAAILRQDISFFDVHKTGEIVNRLTGDVQEFKSSFKTCISQGLRSITQITGCIISLFLISPKMTGLMIIVLPSVIILGSIIGSSLRCLSREAQAQVAKAAGIADEAIGNIRTVRAFAMETTEIELYEQELIKAEALQIKLGYGIGAFQGLSNLALNGIILGVLSFGGLLLSTNELSPGNLMSFLVASQTIQRSLAQFSLLFGQYVRGLAAGARIFQYMNLKPTIPLTGGIILDKYNLKGDVSFEGITFTYPSRPDQVVLNDFNLKVAHGKMVAVCGLSGGGKSTIASLLERFYDVNDGKILLDGFDLRELDPTWLRSEVIGFINQEPVLFATSILENIRYGKPSATNEEVFEASKMANAHDFITDFPEGYQTILGERGVTVSGGQKQRIAIARALLKNPKILILDEATSALDSESEKMVQDALDTIVKSRTVLVIAHRLSTIQNADTIAVVANGRIAEIGNHEMLKRKKGLYWQLIQQQETKD